VGRLALRTSVRRFRLNLLCILFPFLFLTSFGAPHGSFSFASSPYRCVVELSQPLTASSVEAYLEKGPGNRIDAVKRLLDSLGFFSASADTVKDTIHLRAGARSIVDSLRIVAVIPCAIDSVQRGLFPRPYEAGELAVLAEKVLRFFGQKGYPFARLSISVSETPTREDQPSPVQGRARGCVVTFSMRENGRYLFSAPLLLGNRKTKERLLIKDILIKKDSLFDLSMVDESRKRLSSRRWVASAQTGPFQIVSEREAPQALQDVSGHVQVPFIISDNVGLGVDGAIAFQAGSGSAGNLTGIFNISLLNLFHVGETGMLTYRGEQGYQLMEMSLDAPFLFNVPLFGSAGFGLEIKENDYGYLHGEIKMTTDMGPFWQWGLMIKGHEVNDSMGGASRFEGLDFVVTRESRPYRAGERSSEADFKVGSGLVQNSGLQLNRWHGDALYGMQWPFNFRHAVIGRVVFGTILTNSLDTLKTVELYRTGGYKSLRGYSDNEFPFRTVMYEQLEYHFYFNYSGSLFIFMDAGMGFYRDSPVTAHAAQKLLGYGAGIQVPVKIGDASIEWARNYAETSGWGRIHLSIRNNLAAAR
jgi:hypothetical protein